MDKVIIASTVIGLITYGILTMARILTDFSIKKKLIAKDLVEKDTSQLFKSSEDKPDLPKKFAALKWGLVAFFGGISFILIDIFDVGGNHGFDSPMAFGLFITGVALGFLVYFFIVKDKEA